LVKVDKAIEEVKAADYDAIVLPGGQINPDLLLKATSHKSTKTDLMNAGGAWEGSRVVVDQGIITSRKPGIWMPFPRKSSRKWSKDAIPSAAPPSFRHPRGRRLPTRSNAGCHFGFFLKDQLLVLCKFRIAAAQQYCFSYAGSSLFCGQITGASRVRKKEPAMFANLVRLIREWKRYNQSLSELSRLGDRELADIGISRSDIHRVAWNAAHPH
jgi:uncharacterized protein YjiS (DUF1127 family)